MLTVDEKNLSITDGVHVLPYTHATEFYTIDACIMNVVQELEDLYEEFDDEEENEILNEVDKILDREFDSYSTDEKIDIMTEIVNYCNKENITNIFDSDMLDDTDNIIHQSIKNWFNKKHGVDLFDNEYL